MKRNLWTVYEVVTRYRLPREMVFEGGILENYEGVRVNLDRDHGNGWFLLRLSLHDPLLPLNIESNSPGGLRRIARELAPFLAEQTAVDAGALLEAAV